MNHTRPDRRQAALALTYPSSPLKRKRFEELYRDHCRKTGKLVSERALETRWRAYRGILRAYKHRGGSFFTTNGQRARQLEKDGRPRCERTVRRVHRDLEAMGVAIVKHKVRSGPARVAGKLDCLAIALCPVSGQSYVRPRRADRGEGPSGPTPPDPTSTSTALSAPPSAADNVGPPSGPLPASPAGSEGVERDRKAAFEAMWRAAGLPAMGARPARLGPRRDSGGRRSAQ